jgi:hypothetical protein
MFKKYYSKLLFLGILIFTPGIAFAASNDEVANFTHDALTVLIVLAAIASTFFLIRGGYIYITSTGNPEALEDAKKTIRNALIGLVVVISAGVFSALLNNAMTQPSSSNLGQAVNLNPIQPVEESGSLAKILLDAIAGFLKNIVQSIAKPVIDGIVGFLTNTPALSTNSVVFNFWLIIVGITDSLFALVIALLGFRIMSSTTFGFEELTLKEILPRIAFAFVMANTSIFIIDWLILLCQTLVHAVITATGGIGSAWILNAFDPTTLASGNTPLVTLIFMIIFVVLAVVLLIFYIGRLIILAFGAVMSPLVWLLWLVPRTSSFAENSFSVYLITIFVLFVHVVIIQLSSSFLTIAGQSGTNPIISILVGIAMLAILLKSTSIGVQLALSSQTTGFVKKISGQIINVISANGAGAAKTASASATRARRHI